MAATIQWNKSSNFRLLDKYIPVGGHLMAHDARKRKGKGKFLVPMVQRLDNWETQVHDFSDCGLFYAKKIRAAPSPESQRSAAQCLRRLRLEPKEVISAILPRSVCGLVMKLLPRSLVRAVSEDN
jgi:hypothetical protein